VAAVSSSIRLYPVTVLLEKGTAGLQKDSIINLAQLLTLDKARLIKNLGHLDSQKLMVLDQALAISVGLS
jgi:mRNA interferase MazF